MRRVVIRCLLAVGVLLVCAQAWANAPEQFEVVESFAARLSAGDLLQLRRVLSNEVVLVEHDAFVTVAVGPQAHARFRAWIAEGVRLEVAFESVLADGSLIVTAEQMWRDDVPEHLLPLRSTGVYVVDGGHVQGITRYLDADQLDAVMREAIFGDWRHSGYVFSYHPDGTYGILQSGRAWDSGDYTVEGGVMRVVSDERAQACQAGDVGVWTLSFASPDRHTLDKIEDMCLARVGPMLTLYRITD